MDLDNIQRKYGLPAPLPVVQNGKLATRFPLNLEHRGDDVFQFGGKYIGEIENIYDLLYKILTNQEIDASLALPYAIKITEDKLYIRDKTNSEWILIFDITKPNFPKEIELYELIYKVITHQVIGEDTSYPGQFKIEENILYVRDKDNLTWTQIGDVTKEFLGATEATQAILDQVNEILTEVQELKTELNRQIATTNETLTTVLQAANEAMTSAQSINIRTFNSVEEMKASNTLKAGALAKTIGFYTAGDGGGADYVIVSDIGEDEVDEASLITLKNELYAKLLIQDYVNVKWFGAYGDGENDDTQAIQKAIDFSFAYIKENTLNIKPVVFPTGNYKITNSLNIKPIHRLKSAGQVCLDFYINDNNTKGIIINNYQDNYRNDGWWCRPYLDGYIIDGTNGGFIFRNLSCAEKGHYTDDYFKGTAIQYGNLTDSEDKNDIVAHTHIKNCIFNFWESGIEFGTVGFYLNAIENCRFEWCTNNLKINNSGTIKNSGENIRLINNVFANSRNAFYFVKSGMFINGYGNSFDYLVRLIYAPTTNNREIFIVNLTNGYMEKTGFLDLDDSYGMIVAPNCLGKVVFDGYVVAQYTKSYNLIQAPGIDVTFSNGFFSIATVLETPYTMFSKDNNVYFTNMREAAYGVRPMSCPINNIIGNNSFTTLKVSSITGNNQEIEVCNGWTLRSNLNASLELVDIQDFYSNKGIKVTLEASSTQKGFYLTSPYIPIEACKGLCIYFALKANKEKWRYVKCKYYDKDLNDITPSDPEGNDKSYIYTPYPVKDGEIHFPAIPAFRSTPALCSYVKIEFGVQYSSWKAGDYFTYVYCFAEVTR